jgi:hypothetical protein
MNTTALEVESSNHLKVLRPFTSRSQRMAIVVALVVGIPLGYFVLRTGLDGTRPSLTKTTATLPA